jgi:hypothetical protein
MPGIISAALHRSDKGTRVVNYAQWHAAENRKCLLRVGRESWFREMAKFGKPDPHLYAVYFLLDKSDRQSR